MARNEILDELHAARRQILASCNGDIATYLRDAQKRLEASGRPIANAKQRRIRRVVPPMADGIAMDKQSVPTK
jgi:hypothetical protein